MKKDRGPIRIPDWIEEEIARIQADYMRRTGKRPPSKGSIIEERWRAAAPREGLEIERMPAARPGHVNIEVKEELADLFRTHADILASSPTMIGVFKEMLEKLLELERARTEYDLAHKPGRRPS